MKINKFFQQCFKITFQKLFILFYGKVKDCNEYDKLNFKKNKIESVFLKNNIKYDVSNYIYEIPNGRVYTDTVEHVAIIKDNIILPKISYQQINGELKKTKYNKVLSSSIIRSNMSS